VSGRTARLCRNVNVFNAARGRRNGDKVDPDLRMAARPNRTWTSVTHVPDVFVTISPAGHLVRSGEKGDTFVEGHGWTLLRTGLLGALSPTQAFKDATPHDPVFVALGQEIERLGEVRDALAVGGLVKPICDVATPVAAPRTVRFE